MEGSIASGRRSATAQTPRRRVHKHRKRKSVTVCTCKASSAADVVKLCIRDLGWFEVVSLRGAQHCDIYWQTHYHDNRDVGRGAVSKFPGMDDVTAKVSLGRTLETMRLLFPDDYDFTPRSWFLPQQQKEFTEHCQAARKSKHSPVYIVKPDSGSQGDGIYLVTKSRDLHPTARDCIAQEYLDRPLLLDGYKFDFRIYVVLKSIEPLEVYICKEGIARFCTESYKTPSQKNLHKSFMHLTNYSLNKRSKTYQHTDSGDDGSKRTVSCVLKELDGKGYDAYRIWEDIKRLCVKTVIAIVPELKVEYAAETLPGRPGPKCFQILGLDVILLEDGTPMLLEVNSNPSLVIHYEQEVSPGVTSHVPSLLDEQVKRHLVRDTLQLVAPRTKWRKRMREVLTIDTVLDRTYTVLTYTPSGVSAGQACASPGQAYTEEGEGCLDRIHPDVCSDLYEPLRCLEKAALIFIHVLGTRVCGLKMGSTAFRTFVRKYKLINAAQAGMTSATIDIMFIDLMKKWDDCGKNGRTGLCFQGFIDAILIMARKMHPDGDMLSVVESLLSKIEFPT